MPSTQYWFSVAYGNGLFVAPGYNTAIAATLPVPLLYTTAYTVPSSTTSVVTDVTVANSGNSTVPYVHININSVPFATNLSVASKDFVYMPTKQVLSAGDVITASSNVSDMVLHVNGIEVS